MEQTVKVRRVTQEQLDLLVKLSQLRALDLVLARDLPDQQLTIGVDAQPLTGTALGPREGANQGVVFGGVAGLATEEVAGLVNGLTVLSLDHDAGPGGTRVTARAAVNVNDQAHASLTGQAFLSMKRIRPQFPQVCTSSRTNRAL